MTNDSNINEDSFTVVTSQRRKYKIKKNNRKSLTSLISSEGEINEDLVIRRLQEAQIDLRVSPFYGNVVHHLQLVLRTFENAEKQLVCIGIGHFSECSISRHQLAFILLIREQFKFASIKFHEPVLTRSEVNILKKLNCSIAVENVEGKILIEGVTLIYAPHCPKQLINNLFWKNWSSEKLSQIIYIGNSFNNLLNSTPSRFLKIDATFIVKIHSHCKEIALKNNFQFSDIFNDTSIHHFFTVKNLPEQFWTEIEEPVYQSDNLELVTIDLVDKLKFI